MATDFDFDALRAQTMGAGNDEAVTVNTRALIDKVLARYSGEWTTLRELLQNAADASATKVIIRFHTLPSATVPVPQSSEPSVRLRHVLLNHTVKSLVVENNGTPFKVTDWSRLKKIAEGNPDETKIGAFGVGFYSVFAECEEPFVSSGNEALAFYWKGDSLFTRKLHLENVQNANTTFVLPMRSSTSPVPSLLSLCQFLASSLTFVGLEYIELRLDEWRIFELHKVIAPSIDIKIPEDVVRKTQEGLMQVNSVTQEASQLHARWLKAVEWKPKLSSSANKLSHGLTPKTSPSTPSLRQFFSRLAPGTNNAAAEKAAKDEIALQNSLLDDLLGESDASIFLHVNKANVSTLATKSFSSELERATKKPPPRSTTVALLTASYDEHTASNSTMTEQTRTGSEIFKSVFPTKGRIFIGFPTNQTTGLNAHISTPSVIPTVERESIDLNDRFVRVWNKELLRVAGIVARIAWTSDMADLRAKLSRNMLKGGRKDVSNEDIMNVLPEAVFLHKTFTFAESTPSSEVGNLVEEGFWTCNMSMSIDVLSSRGVLPSSSVRVSTEDLGFVEGIPILPDAMVELGFVKRLRDYGVITEITISDIKIELEGKALRTEQLKRFLEWLGHKSRINEIDSQTRDALLGVAVANDEEEHGGKVLILSEMKNFLNVSRIPAEMPVPPSTMPFKFTKKMGKQELEALGWEDLQMVPWVTWLIENIGGRGDLSSDQDFAHSHTFARAVLPVISKQWDGLSQTSKARIVELLKPRTVMPTKFGMRKPTEAYFPSVKLFDDLPVVVSIHGVKDKLLVALGVRKTIDIGVVFERLMTTSPIQKNGPVKQWSHVDLIKYLASVRNDIPSADIKRLRTTPICLAESPSSQASEKRYLISDLFEPDEALRLLKLPIIYWPGVYHSSSAEARFLSFLGLRAAPSYLELIKLMSTSYLTKDFPLYEHALKYFVHNNHTKGYATYDHASVTTPYLPVQGEDRLETPVNCFINERAAMLGFSILKKELHIHASKFGVQNDPPIEECIRRLLNNPPQTRRNARELFEYFAGRLTEIDRERGDVLSDALIVPVLPKSSSSANSISEKSERLHHIAPRNCFLGNDDRYAEIFDYVDFGQQANTFLIRCGSKHEPTTTELAMYIVREPLKLFVALQQNRYLQLLRNLAESWPNLKKNKELIKAMKTARFLLAYRDTPFKAVKADHEDEDDQVVRIAELASASQIIIVDDVITYNQFKSNLLAAPQEEALENFYYNLGAPELGSLVEEHHNVGISTRDQSTAVKLQKLIQERTRLYLHDFQPDLVKHDGKWVEKNLSVICVQSISLRKSLTGHRGSHSESRSAAIKPLNRGFTLYITVAYDLFEVSQVLVPLLLNRSKTQNIMMLEMMLATNLHKLQARGYNVQRILRQKAAEAQIAEATRQAQMDREAEEIKNLEARWIESQKATNSQRQNSMPGVFPDSPDHKQMDRSNHPEADQVVQRPRGFFSDISKRLGFENGKHPLLQSGAYENSVNGRSRGQGGSEGDVPPPYTLEDKENHPTHFQPETVTAPHHLQQNLVNAIQASRAHNSTTISTQPAVNEVKETKSYCDARPGQNITYVGEISNVRIFLSKSVNEKLNRSATNFLAANASALGLFVAILQDCASVFSLAKKTIHIFYDESGSTIAFNQSKALFFNYRYFENLQLPLVQQGNNASALIYWFVVMAHELAHNLVEDHSANHSYYTEALIVQYFSQMAAKTATPSTSSTIPAIPPIRTDTSRSTQAQASQSLLDVD